MPRVQVKVRPCGPGARVVIYARVSADPKERRGKSVDDQVTELCEWAERQGWIVVAVIMEKGSASRHQRKERKRWPEVTKLILDNSTDILLTHENSRGTRQLGEYAELRQVCADTGAWWGYGDRLYNLNDSTDRKDSARDALASEEETDRDSLRSHKGIRGGVRKGRPAGGPSGMGFRRIYDPDSGALLGQEIHEGEAAVLREAGDRALSGEASLRIVNDFNARGIPAPGGGKWETSILRQTLLRPAIAGLRKRDGEIAGPGKWPAIIEPEKWFKIRDHFADPSRRTQRTTQVRWLMSGIVLCHKCDAPCEHAKIKGNRHQYQCPQRHAGRKVALVDAVVEQALFQRLGREDAAELFRVEIDAQETVQAAKNELATLKARLDGFYSQAAIGALSPTGLVAVEGPLLVEIEKAANAARVVGIPPVVAELIAPTPAEVERRWRDLHIEQQRTAIRATMRVVLNPAPSGRPDRGSEIARKLVRSIKVTWLTDTEPEAIAV